jgi:acyl carrier protein
MGRSMKTVLELLKAIRPELDFSASQDFIGDGMIDSFDLITLVAAMEDEFSIKIDGSDIVPENFMNLECLENLIKKSGSR